MMHRLGWIMLVGAVAIFALVLVLTAYAIHAPRQRRAWLGSRAAVIWGGIVFPVAVLTALLVYGLTLAGSLARPPAEPPLRIAVTGEQYWWRVRYLGADGAPVLVSANEVRIPTGRPVEFILTSADVIHSFWAPALGGKLDMIPGRENSFVVEAARPGAWRGQCAEFCGAQHALMAFDVIAHEPAEFERWLQAEAAPAASPADALALRGERVFAENGCGACHTVRGGGAAGLIGPDLTHIGSRATIAAGALANNAGSLAAWIAHSQEIKPGNLMPSFDFIGTEDLTALAAYLEGLR